MSRGVTYLLVVLLVLVAGSLAAQDFVLTGQVIAADGDKPVEGADVILLNTPHRAFTSKKGHYRITGIKAGTYNITAFGLGMEPISQTITFDTTDLEVDFALVALSRDLTEVQVEAEKDNSFGITRLRPVEGTAVYSGMKSEVVVMEDVLGNLATNNSRQVYAKVSGLNIWESDGAGIQLGIGGRGLNPNRVSNFNTRQNGYDISADALGYPESYYSPPTEALERIEIVRGAASLQYGTQFGGFINFKLKQGSTKKKAEVETRQTVGSFGLVNSFNSVGGTIGKVQYYTFYQHKRGNGWRPNSGFEVNTGYAAMRYKATKKLTLGAEYTGMHYLAQQAGGLTDAQFAADPRQSIRDRNWFQVNWNLAAVTLDYTFNTNTELNWRNFGLIAGRDAVGFLGQINRADHLQERDLLTDQYRNFGSELRVVHRYGPKDNPWVALVGARVYQGHTDRKQGFANDGFDGSFDLLNPDAPEHSAYVFPSRNIAVFTENIFKLSKRWSITPGARFEYIDTRSEGHYNVEFRDLAGNVIFQDRVQDDRSFDRSFVLFGVGASYKPNDKVEYYGNISQNYRSVNFNDMRIVNPNFRVDPNLSDERGFSADIGVRGNHGDLINFDVSAFLLSYRNRIGVVWMRDTALYNIFLMRTNISDSRTYGIESFAEVDLLKLFLSHRFKSKLTLFGNFAVMDAYYYDSDESAFDGNKVELVPPVTLKTGLAYKRKQFKTSVQYSYTHGHFSDATNTDFTTNAVYGTIPSYQVIDFAAEYSWKWLTAATGINNVANTMYFTRRASGYPGPGIIPSDGRNVYLTVAAKF